MFDLPNTARGGGYVMGSSGGVFDVAEGLKMPAMAIESGPAAGVIAAVQSGRMGAKTLLVERNSQLGGTMTTGGVNFPGLFHAWGKQIIAGIGWELVTKTVEIDAVRLGARAMPRGSCPERARMG